MSVSATSLAILDMNKSVCDETNNTTSDMDVLEGDNNSHIHDISVDSVILFTEYYL